MSLPIENINVNCHRYLNVYNELFSYICNECIKAVHKYVKIPFHLLVYSGGWFFYIIGHGANLFSTRRFDDIFSNKSSVAFFYSRYTDGGYASREHGCAHSRLYSYFLQTSKGSHKGKVCACTALATYLSCRGANLFSLQESELLPVSFNTSSVAFLWFRVSESGHRYAHKTPFQAEFQDKNSTPENSRYCRHCPKPDNLRPKKPFNRFFRESLVRNNSLSLGRLVYCTGKCWSVNLGGFLREEGAMFKQKLNFKIMTLKDVYELSKKMDGIFLQNMLDLYFPSEHEAYHMLSEGGDECCLDALSSSVGSDYKMPEEFDLLIECYEKHYHKEEYDKIREFVEGAPVEKEEGAV